MKRTLSEVERHPVFKALNPIGKRFMIARFLPDHLNPFAAYQIKVAALVPFTIFPHIKTIPAFQMLLEDFKKGVYEEVHTLVVPSSGNTVHGIARLARAYDLKVKAVMSSDVPDSKAGILKAFGIGINVFQVGNVAETTLEEAAKPGHFHLDQYSHPGNPRSHEHYTGPEIARVLEGHSVHAIAAALGSAGTALGLVNFISKSTWSSGTRVIGVRPKLGEQVPGARDEKKMFEVVRFAWQQKLAAVTEISRKEAFLATRELWSAVEPQPGPTSGMAWAGLRAYLHDLVARHEEPRGQTVAFVCPDDGRFYSAQMIAELDPDQGLV